MCERGPCWRPPPPRSSNRDDLQPSLDRPSDVISHNRSYGFRKGIGTFSTLKMYTTTATKITAAGA